MMPDHTEWVRIDLGAEQEIDLIALVPALARGGYNAYDADALSAQVSNHCGH